MSDVAIRLEGLSKEFTIGSRERYQSLRDVLGDVLRYPLRRLLKQDESPLHQASRESSTIWALKDITLDLEKGDILGIVGRNGAGKSTLLKILTGITDPTEGTATIHGRIGALLEVGTGFHDELTGRENIYVNGAILGMSRKDIDRRFDDIVAFSGVGPFIDTMVRFYSSGMYMRLAFSVAAHVDPDVLIVDEVLAVGDADFQRKCLGKIDQVAHSGRTVLFVSHNMRTVSQLCDKCLWLDQGRMVELGRTDEVVPHYLASARGGQLTGEITPAMHEEKDPPVLFRRVAMQDEGGRPLQTLFFRAPLRLGLELEVMRPVDDAHVRMLIDTPDGTRVATLRWGRHDHKNDLAAGRYTATIESEIPLAPGAYTLSLEMHAPRGEGKPEQWSRVPRALDFDIETVTAEGRVAPRTRGILAPKSKWDVKRVE